VRIIALVLMIRESALAYFDIQTRAVRLEFQLMTGLTNEGSLTLRPASTADQDLFLQLYKSSRGDDLRGLGWDEDRISEFLDMQYEAQVSFYATDFPNASDEIALWDSQPVGRLIVDRRADEIRLVDIALLPGHRNRGFGSQIVRGLQAEAAAQHKPLRLQVIRFNRALGLFERLGFVRASETGTHFQMEWISEAQPRSPQTSSPAGLGR
jgi:GNAT superfamily N-acetyltransferase